MIETVNNFINSLTPDGKIALLALTLSVFNGIVNFWMAIRTNKQNKRINSIEYKTVENTQEVFASMKNVLQSINREINATKEGETINLTNDINTLSNITLHTAGYPFLVSLIQEEDQNRFQNYIHLLSHKVDSLERQKIKECATGAIEILNKEYIEKVIELVSKKEYGAYNLPKKKIRKIQQEYKQKEDINAYVTKSYNPDFFKQFVAYLVKDLNVNDADVLLFYGVVENNPEIVQEAIGNGANVNITDLTVIDRYKEQYRAFYKKNNSFFKKLICWFKGLFRKKKP